MGGTLLARSAANPWPMRTLRGNGRSERREAVVGDRAARRALKVERGHADLSGGDRLDGLEGEDEHLRVGGRSGRLVRNADEYRAVGVDAVSEAAGLFNAEIAARANRHGFENGRVETQLHRRRAYLLARGDPQRHVEARARPRARRPFPPELRGPGLCRAVRYRNPGSSRGNQFCHRGGWRSRRWRSTLRAEHLVLEGAERQRLAGPGSKVDEAHLGSIHRVDLVLAVESVAFPGGENFFASGKIHFDPGIALKLPGEPKRQGRSDWIRRFVSGGPLR